MKTTKDFLNIFDQYSKDFWESILKRLKNDFEIWRECEGYEGESFEQTLETEFWSMGCDYVDYAKSITEDYFLPIIGKKELESLDDEYIECDLEYSDLYRLIFETYAIPNIQEIIRNSSI
jgi:hypothetical protein